MIKIIIILIIIFLINNFLFQEKFSNTYQDSELADKLIIVGSNLQKDKVLLTLYYDRREINCKYFYDYFSTNFGGEDFSVETFTNPPPSSLRFTEDIQFSGENQAWNLIKQLYANQTDQFINPSFMNIEEVEVDQFNLANFNNVYAHKIINSGVNIGKVEYLGENIRNYKQFYRPNDFLPKIPYVTLTFLKHKGFNEMEEILKNEKRNAETQVQTYDRIKYNTLKIYDLITVKYEGIYSPNNRAIQSTVDNIKNFVKDSCEKYLETSSQLNHTNRINGGETPSFLGSTSTHLLSINIPSSPHTVITKCNECSEFMYI